MILRLAAILAALAGLASLAPEGLLVLLVATVLIMIAVALSTRGLVRPWSDIAAWGSMVGLLVLTPMPARADPMALVLTTLVVVTLAATIHVPDGTSPAPRIVQGLLVLAITATVAFLVLFLPAWRLEAASLGVLDPVTPAGMALRAAAVLGLAAGLAAAFVLARAWLWQKQKKQIDPREEGLHGN